MITDKYLIGLIAEHMYIPEERVMSEDFKFVRNLSNANFSVDLSKVENIYDLSTFSKEFEISLILNNNEDLEKFQELSDKVLKNSDIQYLQLIGSENNTVDMGKFEVPENKKGNIEVEFKELDLSDLELVNNNNGKINIKIQNCMGIDVDNMMQQVNDVNKIEFIGDNQFNSQDSVASHIRELKFSKVDFEQENFSNFENVDNLKCNSCENIEDFVSSCNAKNISISNGHIVDLDRIASKADQINIENYDFLYLSRNFEGPTSIKIDSSSLLAHDNGCISVPKISLYKLNNFDSVLQNGSVLNCDALEIGNLNIDDNVNIDSKILSDKEEVCFNSCNIHNVNDIGNINNVDKVLFRFCSVNRDIEDVLVRYRNDNVQFHITGMNSNDENYDLNRINEDISIDKLDANNVEKLLKDNKYVQTLIISSPVSSDVKEIFDEYAQDKFIRSGYSKGTVTYDEYKQADEKFDDIVQKIDPSWSELEKAKFLYNEIGMIVSYDNNVLEKSHYKDEQEIPYFESANNRARNIYSEVLSGKGVCAGYADMYKYLCEKAGINCEVVHNDVHAWNFLNVHDKDGIEKSFFADLTNDATKIKMQMRSSLFGVTKEELDQSSDSYANIKGSYDVASLSNDEKKEIDEKVGFFRHGNEYMNEEYVGLIGRIVKSEGSNKDTAEYIMNSLTSYDSFKLLKEQEPYDRVKLFVDYSNLSRKDGEKLDIGVTPCYARFKDTTEKQAKSIVWARDGENVSYYTYSPKKENFEKLDKEFLEEVIGRGFLEFYPENELPGIEEVDKGNGTFTKKWVKDINKNNDKDR